MSGPGPGVSRRTVKLAVTRSGTWAVLRTQRVRVAP